MRVLMDQSRFDLVAKSLATAATRRAAFRRLGGAGLASLGLAGRARSAAARPAPSAIPPVQADPQTLLDALDPDTRDSIARALWTDELRADDLEPEILTKLNDPKNSNAAFGTRTGIRILELINDPTSYVPSYLERHTTLLPLCKSLSPHQAYIVANLLGPENTKGYRPMPAAAEFDFPRSNAMDLDAQVGWYFFVGSATGSNGTEYGVELMFFRYALLPPPLAAELGLTPTENQVVELHFAVAKAGERHYQAKPIVVAGTTGLLTFDQNGLGASLGKNTIASTQPDSLFPLRLQAQGRNDGGDESIEFAVDLTFASGKGYLLQMADGCAPCCDGLGTLYYSMPNLRLDPAGSTLTIQGEEVQLTDGTFWFDHQWGMLAGVANTAVVRAANNLSPAAPGGWDWFEAQFTGDRQITVFSIHSHEYLPFYFQTGPTPPGTMTVAVKGKYMDPAAVTHDVTGTLAITEWIKSVDSPAPADYPPTNTWYPNRWEFAFGPEVPADIRAFVMQPIVETGQSGFFANGSQYSEGAVYLLDPDGADIGRGFAESVAYAQTRDNALRLVGLPATEEMLALFGDNPPSEGLTLASQAYALLHGKELQEVIGTCRGL
jgi:predicted secreted hydrolase